jgi:hypothetical protein
VQGHFGAFGGRFTASFDGIWRADKWVGLRVREYEGASK